MKKELKSPIEILITIVTNKELENVVNILEGYNECNGIHVLGYGTVDSEIVDLFGFGLFERVITFSIIEVKNSKTIIEKLNEELNFTTEDKMGIAFTIPINSIEKEFFNTLTKGENNGKN